MLLHGQALLCPGIRWAQERGFGRQSPVLGKEYVIFILGLQGSPRINGNTATLLKAFLSGANNLGARVSKLEISQKKIYPCRNCATCEKEGFCSINDDMQEIYPLLRQADVIAMATPVFFYGPTAQMKALIDRSQALWVRKYVHNLVDPGRKWRKGFLLSLGATRGNNLFEGIKLTAKYFFDAVGANFEGNLTYRKIEEPEDIKKHPTALTDAKTKADDLTTPLLARKKVLFLCRENAARSQMASVFTQYYAGDRIEAESGGSQPAREVNPHMVKVMEEGGIDMAFRRPKSVEEISRHVKTDLIVSMGCEEECPYFSGISTQNWNLPDPAGQTIEFMRRLRDEIERRVGQMVKEF